MMAECGSDDDHAVSSLKKSNARLEAELKEKDELILEFLPFSHCHGFCVLTEHASVKKVVFHVGTNSTGRQKSKLMRRDFTGLFELVKVNGNNIFILGPIHTLCWGV